MLPFESLGGVVALYVDGLASPVPATQDRILVVGPSALGPTDTVYQIGSLTSAENRFGVESELMKAAYELYQGGADNVAVMRTGGRTGLINVTNGDEVISITPKLRDDDILDRYALLFSNSGGLNRLAMWDKIQEEWVFDSDEILVTDNSNFDVVGLEDFSVGLELGDFDDPSIALSCTDLEAESDPFGDGVTAVTGLAGDDGVNASLVEKYAALNSAYLNLSYKDAAGLLPVGVYIDSPNVTDASLTYGLFWKGLPAEGSASDKLGYAWQYVYQGVCHTYFTDTQDYFTVALAGAAKVHGAMTLSAQKDGKGGNACQLQVVDAAAIDVTVSETDFGILVYVEADVGTSTYTDVVAAINAALDGFTLANGVLASDLLSAAVTGTGSDTVTALSRSNLTGGTGGHFLTHEDLTGDAVPAAVQSKFEDGTNAQLREVNFAHQLASACYLASAQWQDCLGVIDFKAPASYSSSAILSHLGSAPMLTTLSGKSYINAVGDNGNGVLGHKLVSGKAVSGGGYRNAAIEIDAPTNAGMAFGGMILTKGLALPNAGRYVYGISDGDEALDARKRPVDIGKHIFVNAAWGSTVSGWNRAARYNAPASRYFLAKIFSLDVNVEAVGENGALPDSVEFRQMTIPVPVQAELASMRIVFVKDLDGSGGTIKTFGSAKTAALPTSDYSRMSTIRCVNLHLKGIRDISRPYQGKSFTAGVLMSLQATLDQYCREMANRGYSRGSACKLSYTAVDRVAGNLSVTLTIKPPYSIETITVSMTISRD